MKAKKVLMSMAIILVIILIGMVSFGGIFVQKQNRMENVLPSYLLGMDLKGARHVHFKVDTSTEEKKYDNEGNLLTEEEAKDKEDVKTVQEPINKQEILTEENFQTCKKIMEKRLETAGINEYTISQDVSGGIFLQLPEETKTDTILGTLYATGDFKIIDSDTKDNLLDLSKIKSAKVLYGSDATGRTVYLSIAFDKEGAKKLEEISKTYVETKDEEGNSTKKQISVELDGQALLTTYFGETLTNGVLQIPIGNSTTNASEMQKALLQASSLAMLLNSGKLPIEYQLGEQKYISTDITEQTTNFLIYVAIGITVLMILVEIAKYKKLGLMAGIAHIGYIGALLLVLRYTNVSISISGVLAIIIGVCLNYILWILILGHIKKSEKRNEAAVKKSFNESAINFIMVIIPVFVLSVVFCFVKWAPMISFGMIMFWSLIVIGLYNYIITRTLLCNSVKE